MNTEILLPVPELKQALAGLNKLIGRKNTLPVLGHVRITRKNDGLVRLQGTDLDAHATYTLNNPQQGEVVDVLVPLEQLNKASKCSGSKDAVAIVCEDQNTRLRYHIAGSQVNQPIQPLPVGEWPSAPAITIPSTPLPVGFGEALRQAMACCSEDPSRAVLRGACLDARDAKAHYIIGTNGRFLYSANSFTFPMKEAVIVPDSKFINGSGLLDGDGCFMALQTGKKPGDIRHICIENGPWRFVTREIEGQYPNWKQVLPVVDASWTLVKLQPEALEQLLKVIPNLPGTDHENKTLRLRTAYNCLWVEGRGREDKDWTKIAISEVTITGKMKEITLNRDYLLPALRFGLSELAIQDELSPMVCSKEGKRMVIMPVRPMENAAAKPKQQTAPAAVPPVAEVKPVAEEKEPAMPKDNIKPEPVKPAETSLLSQIEQIRETVKNVVRDLTSLTDAAKQMERDKRAGEKEVETARSVLKKLQQVSI